MTQVPAKRQKIVTTHAATTRTASVPMKSYARNLPKCHIDKFHHKGSCREMHCKNCNEKGHTTHFSRVSTRQVTQVANARATNLYECGETGHFKRDCRRARNVGDDGRVLMITAVETLPEPPAKHWYVFLNFS